MYFWALDKYILVLVHVLELEFLLCHFLMLMGENCALVIVMRLILMSCAGMLGAPDATYMVAY